MASDMSPTWLILIYTVPSEPSRLRASVWRELKKVGAVYLRDGVCVLPARPETISAFRAIAARILDLGGQETLIEDVRLDPAKAQTIIDQATAARTEEYAEVGRDVDAFLVHVEREREHREFTYPEMEELEADLGKLRRWTDQIHARDYFGAEAAAALEEQLTRSEEALAAFLDEVYQNTEELGP